MPGVFYSQKKLKSMKLMKINTQGPFNLDNCLKFMRLYKSLIFIIMIVKKILLNKNLLY